METFIQLKKPKQHKQTKNHTHLPRSFGFTEEVYQDLAIVSTHKIKERGGLRNKCLFENKQTATKQKSLASILSIPFSKKESHSKQIKHTEVTFSTHLRVDSNTISLIVRLTFHLLYSYLPYNYIDHHVSLSTMLLDTQQKT